VAVDEPADRAATRAGYDAIAAPYTELFGAELSRTVMDRAVVVALLEGTGFDVVARVVRAPEPGSAASKTPQGAVIARRPELR
jgi:hypothetical protein